ncbi:UNC93-like protein isoform X2 [Dysidea avara]|uniref:UNC93-like protein isoform X2 n=1 Tax=Dysidea avara TaxID=196820 RepID=UPI00332EB3FB
MDDNGESAALERHTSDHKACSKQVAYKNVTMIGLVSLLNYSAISPTITMMTSVAGKKLGSLSYGLNYVFTCLFSFLTISLLNNFSSRKKLLLFGVLCIIGFTACNWYTSYYTLIPGAVLFGFGVPVTWITSLVYVKEIAVYYARNSTQKDTNIASYFTGIVVAFSLVGYLVGNATIAGILTLLKSDDVNNNATTVNMGSNFTESSTQCYTNDDALEFNFVTTNVLRGVIVFYPLLALAIVVLFIDDLAKQHSKVFLGLSLITGAIKQIWLSAVSMTKLVTRKEMFLTCPIYFTTGISVGFMFARYTKTYVAECVGVHVVGYVIMIYGFANSLGSFVTGKLLALEAKFQVVLAALTFHLAILVFLVIWEREPLLSILLTIPFLYGICDGAWMTVCSK